MRQAGSAARLMAALVAAGGKRLEIGLDWHPPIWLGRPRLGQMPGSQPSYVRPRSKRASKRRLRLLYGRARLKST